MTDEAGTGSWARKIDAITLFVEDLKATKQFYQDVLGFRLSDYTLRPFKAYFFHLNPRHHSFAVIETGRNSVHHLMVELYMLDDVGQAYDLALGQEDRIATTLDRKSTRLNSSHVRISYAVFCCGRKR